MKGIFGILRNLNVISKRILSPLMIIIFLALFLENQAQASPTLNAFVENKKGQQISLNEFKGKVVYLDFWASWCGPCRKSFPWMQAVYSKYQSQGLVIIAVNLDTEKNLANQFLTELANREKLNVSFPIRYDPEGKLANQFDLQGMPSSYLFDRSGKLVTQHVGFFEKNKTQYEQELVHLLRK